MKLVANFKAGPVYEYILENEFLKISALNFGASITSIYMKNRDGDGENVVASFQDVMDYERQPDPYLNAIVGPVAGRIAYGTYCMGDTQYKLSINNNLHHLHGGASGISKQHFTVMEEKDRLHFHLETTHEVDGFPKGVYTYDITYQLCENKLVISYIGIPPNTSLLNMTSHLYFNLSGNMKSSIQEHSLWIPSKQKMAIHADGHPYKVETIATDSAFDFSTLRNIGKNYKKGASEFTITRAYDTAFFLEKAPIILYHEDSGRKLSIESDASSVVMYTANYFDNSLLLQPDTSGYPMCAIALETQHIPNGVNIPNCDTHAFADREHPYTQQTTYTFAVK